MILRLPASLESFTWSRGAVDVCDIPCVVEDLDFRGTEAERLRLKVAGCELTMRRSDVKQNALAAAVLVYG